ERRLGHGDGDHAVQIFAIALEEGVLLHMQDDIQVAGRAGVMSGLALSGKAHARAVLHSGRDFELKRLLHHNAALAPALLAGIGDDGACAAARRARARDAEEALLVAHLSAARALRTSGRRLPCRRAGAVTVGASFVTSDFDFGLDSEGGFLELERQVLA